MAKLYGKDLQLMAARARLLAVDAVHTAASGHPGGSLSCMDIVTALYFNEMKVEPANPLWKDRDRFVLSKGHCAPALYSVLALRGYFPVGDLKLLRSIEGHMSGHPDMQHVPGVDMSTGSLGQGLSTAVGMALAAKLKAASNQAIFAWDLMLLSCSRVEAGRVVYDCGSLIKKIEGIPALKMGVSGSQSLQLEHSVILRDEKVRSDLRKAAGRGDSLLSEQLEKTLKAWGKARRPDNGHGKRLSSDPPAAEKKGLFSIFDRSDRGGRTEKSDRGFIFDDYDGDSGKRGRNRRR